MGGQGDGSEQEQRPKHNQKLRHRTLRCHQRPPSPGEMERQREEVRKLEEVGQLPESSPTRQLVQMAAEVEPLMSVEEKPAQKKLWPTMGGKDSRKEFLKAGMLKRPWKYQLGKVALHKIHQFQKSTELLIHKHPFSHLVHKIAQEAGNMICASRCMHSWLYRKLQSTI